MCIEGAKYNITNENLLMTRGLKYCNARTTYNVFHHFCDGINTMIKAVTQQIRNWRMEFFLFI